MTDKVRPGDVMRWDKVWMQDISDDPLWCLVLSEDPVDPGAFTDVNLNVIAIDGPDFVAGDQGDFNWPPNEDYASAVIVPPEEWPDEIVIAVAKYRLTGEV